MKRVLSIQDLSCLGRCSMTVTVPVLSAMGIQCVPMPTAVLSTHTAFPDPYVRDLSQDLLPIMRHWKSIGAEFDAICVGYLSGADQAAAVAQVLEAFPARVILDPVLGDHGKCYSRITDAHIQALRGLCPKADVLLPNVTEACLLTGISYRESAERAWYAELLQAVLALGVKAAVLTGVSLAPGHIGCMGYADSEEFSFQDSAVNRQCHGTGDLFAAVFTAELTRGNTIAAAAQRAGNFVAQALAQSPEVSAFGLPLEAMLPQLWNN